MAIKVNIKLLSAAVVFALFLGSCGGLKTGSADMSADSVSIAEVAVVDTTSYKIGNKRQCSVKAEAEIAYPGTFKDKETTARLQRLFSEVVLDVSGDSVKFNDSFKRFVKNVLGEYGEDGDGIKYEADDHEIVYKYNSKTNISTVYNKNGILTFCKEEITRKNDMVTMVSHEYYNISLTTMSEIELNNIFAEESVSDISDLLKHRLLVQLNVKDENELIDRGYFNLDNLVASNNFRIGDDGITWTFGTYEIACYSVGETNITLSYDILKPYILERSEIMKLVQ